MLRARGSERANELGNICHRQGSMICSRYNTRTAQASDVCSLEMQDDNRAPKQSKLYIYVPQLPEFPRERAVSQGLEVVLLASKRLERLDFHGQSCQVSGRCEVYRISSSRGCRLHRCQPGLSK